MSVYDGVVYPGRSVYVSSAGAPIGLAPEEGISATEYSFKNLSTVQNNFVKRNLEAGAPGAGSVLHRSLGCVLFPERPA